MSFKTVFMAVGATQDDAELDRAVAICQGLGAHLSATQSAAEEVLRLRTR